MDIRLATPAEDHILVRHYLGIWDSYGTPADHIQGDAEERISRFIADGREKRQLASFLAVSGDKVVGSASCQKHMSPFPEIIKPEFRQHGYIWSVFVEPDHRRQGLAKRLTDHAVRYLRSIGCTTIVIHASDAGEAVYESLGFKLAKEMRLKFEQGDDS